MARWGNTFISNIFWCGIFGFFAFGFTDEPKNLLVSNDQDWVKYFPMIDSEANEFINMADVGYRFHLFFLMNFIFSILQMVNCQLFFLAIGFGGNYKFIRNVSSITNLVSTILGSLMGVMWLLAVVWRFQPSGTVASGDGLSWDEDKSKTVYFEGQFIAVVALLIAFVFILATVAGFCN